MKARLSWYRLRWPREVNAEQVTGVFRLLAASTRVPVVVEAVGRRGMVIHRVALPSERAGALVKQIGAAILGLALERDSERSEVFARTVELRLSTRRRPLKVGDPASVSRALLTALAHVGAGEAVGVQWVLVRPMPPLAVPERLQMLSGESWLSCLLLAPFGGARPVDGEMRAAMRTKQGEPGWRAIGRLAVVADSPSRQRQLIGEVLGALRSAEAPSVGFRARSAAAGRFAIAHTGWRSPLCLNAAEVAVVSAWPVGVSAELPVSMVGSRLVAPRSAVRRRGRVIGESSFPGSERPLALTPRDSLRHLHVLGPSGVGKSTLLLNLIVQDLRAGRALVVIEPKGDLIGDVLRRTPAQRMGDVVLLDPTDRDCPVGLNPLAPAGRSPELAADQLLGLFHSLYANSWGPRTQDILGASLLTLARTPGMTLAALPLLLSDANFRRQIVPKVADPLGLAPFWASFEAWSQAERLAAIAPTMNKLRPLLMRPELRAIVGQARPRFELRQVFTERKVLLVNLARGLLGPETAALLGSLVVSQLWQAILGRARVAPERRHPVFVYVDEFQDYLHLPVDFADALAVVPGDVPNAGAGWPVAER